MTVKENPIQVIKRTVNSREPLCFQLQDMDGTNLDLTSRTIAFRMVQMGSGRVVVNNASATVDVAASGKVSYTFGGGDLAVTGLYACYFIDTTNTPNKVFPPEGPNFLIKVVKEYS